MDFPYHRSLAPMMWVFFALASIEMARLDRNGGGSSAGFLLETVDCRHFVAHQLHWRDLDRACHPVFSPIAGADRGGQPDLARWHTQIHLGAAQQRRRAAPYLGW
jgi:hypothetical protein